MTLPLRFIPPWVSFYFFFFSFSFSSLFPHTVPPNQLKKEEEHRQKQQQQTEGISLLCHFLEIHSLPNAPPSFQISPSPSPSHHSPPVSPRERPPFLRSLSPSKEREGGGVGGREGKRAKMKIFTSSVMQGTTQVFFFFLFLSFSFLFPFPFSFPFPTLTPLSRCFLLFLPPFLLPPLLPLPQWLGAITLPLLFLLLL